MTRSQVLLSGTALASVLLVAGCSAGQISQTAETVPAIVGANSVPSSATDTILLRNVLLTYPGPEGYRQGATAALEIGVFNNGAEPVTLVRVTTTGAREVTMARGGAAPAPPTGPASPAPTGTPTGAGEASPTATASPTGEPAPAGGPVRVLVAPAGFVLLGPDTPQVLQFVGLTQAIQAGESIPGVRFEFDNGTVITLDVPVGMPESPAPRSPLVFDEAGEGAAGH